MPPHLSTVTEYAGLDVRYARAFPILVDDIHHTVCFCYTFTCTWLGKRLRSFLIGVLDQKPLKRMLAFKVYRKITEGAPFFMLQQVRSGENRGPLSFWPCKI